MKTAFRIRALSVLSGVAAALAGATAQAQPISPIIIIDGGYTEYCSMAAHNPERLSRVLITGSHHPVSPIQLCTLAIEASGDTVNRAASHNNRGVLYFDAGNSEAALADFAEAVRLDASLVLAHINLGNTSNLLERWEQAISAFDRAIELGIEPEPERVPGTGEATPIPEMARVHFNRGIAHENLGQLRDAYLDYRRASELAPDWDDPQQELERFEVIR